MTEENKNLRRKNLALLGLLLSLVVILFFMAIVKVDISSAVNLK